MWLQYLYNQTLHSYFHTSTSLSSKTQRANQMFFAQQDGLRRRMDKLKSSIEVASKAVDKEREKNVSLLHLIFPPHIAKRLWLGKDETRHTIIHLKT